MSKKQTFIIVGASLAGAKAAEELRERGFDGRVVLIGSESERPYERPPLTKDYLRGESDRESTFVHEESFYAQHEISLMRNTTVSAIDPALATVTLADGRELGYDRLLLATGAEPRRIAVPGAELDGIHYLRTLADCDLLREQLGRSARVAVVGAGWIGSEFAASARQGGHEVTLIDPTALPNERIFGAEIGAFYRDVHAQHGRGVAVALRAFRLLAQALPEMAAIVEPGQRIGDREPARLVEGAPEQVSEEREQRDRRIRHHQETRLAAAALRQAEREQQGDHGRQGEELSQD